VFVVVQYTAAQNGNAEIVQKIWDCAKQNLTTEELKNRILLATKHLGQSPLHYATRSGNKHLIEKVWQLTEGNPTIQELNNNFSSQNPYATNCLVCGIKECEPRGIAEGMGVGQKDSNATRL
jgi:hypothetical protein